MTNKNLIELREVDSAVGIFDLPPSPDIEEDMVPELGPAADVTGSLYAPSYIPEDFSTTGSRGVTDHSAETIFNSEYGMIILDQQSIPGHPTVKRGSSEELTVNDKPAYLVRGGWTQYTKDGEVSGATWEADIAVSLMFEFDDHWFSLTALSYHPSHQFDESELVRIAESMQLN